MIKKKLSLLVEILQIHEITVLSCSKLKEEISVVLHRPKFRKYISNKNIIEAIILHDKLSNAMVLGVIKKQNRDQDDDYLFALCKIGKADYLVSGDKDVLESGIEPPPVLLTMHEFLEMYH